MEINLVTKEDFRLQSRNVSGHSRSS